MNEDKVKRLDQLQQITTADERQSLLGAWARADQIARCTSLDEFLPQMLDLIIEVSLAETATFYLFDPHTDELMITCVRGDDESNGLVGLRLKKHLGIVGTAITEAQVVVIGDLPGDPRWLRAVDPHRSMHLRNAITMPLFLNGRLLGALQIFNYHQADLNLLTLLADRLASEMDRLAQMEITQATNQRLRVLIESLGQVAGTMDREHLLYLVTQRAAELVDAERSSIHLVKEGTDELTFQVSYRTNTENYSDSERGAQHGNITSLIENILARKPHISNTGSINSLRFSTWTAMSVPLHAGENNSPEEAGNKHGHVIGGLMALNKRSGKFNDEDMQLLEILANQTSTFIKVAELYENANELFLDALKALVAAIDAKDPYTQGHSLRVSEISVAIAQELGLDDETVNQVRIGSLLHDVGKIGIPDHIIKKKGRLTDEEYIEIKKHSRIGYTIMENVRVLNDALPAISEHHERLDGSGYPLGLLGNQISLLGRIVAVADVFDAMTSDRPYREALGTEVVLKHLQDNAGTQFDAECVQALVQVIRREDDSGL